VAAAKLVAAGLGMSLHMVGVHRIVAILTAVYMVGAIVPWVGLLLFVRG
jgi:ABC-type Fe3+-siderophore transport system permease subunit